MLICTFYTSTFSKIMTIKTALTGTFFQMFGVKYPFPESASNYFPFLNLLLEKCRYDSKSNFLQFDYPGKTTLQKREKTKICQGNTDNESLKLEYTRSFRISTKILLGGSIPNVSVSTSNICRKLRVT